MEYAPVIALSLMTLGAVFVWGAIQLGVVGKSHRKGPHTAFSHRVATVDSPSEVDRKRGEDHEAGRRRHVYKPKH